MAANSNSNSPDEQREAVPTVEETASVKETVAPMVKTPEPTTEPKKTEAPVEQSLVYSRDWNSEESYMLAKIAMAEAEDEDTEGKALVICVVLNRVWSEGFPDGIEAVIFQKNQFSPVGNGRYDRVEPSEDCWKALKMVEEGWDKSRGALYFESESASTWHRDHLKYLFSHGGHMFYTEKED